MNQKSVVIGMSGGVDSSAAAYLLKKEGYNVIGVTMKTWHEHTDTPEDEQGVCDALKVAKTLGIEHHVVDFSDIFKGKVVEPFADEYYKGRTPNPCLLCNRYVKWEALLDFADQIGADYVATGHYASVVRLENGRYSLKKAPGGKDQTYALYALLQEQLSRTLMPAARYTKDEIREIAAKAGLKVADKPDSQDICFIPDGDYKAFLERYTGKKPQPGHFVDQDGRVLGCHSGTCCYTIGQRKGLNLSMGRPVFVTEIRAEQNEVVIGDAKDVFGSSLIASNLNWMAIEKPQASIRTWAKIRYAAKPAACTVTVRKDEVYGDIAEVVFDEPQRAITPGQAVVFYGAQGCEDIVVGGGVIIKKT